MAHREHSEKRKAKPRGRPFPKNNRRGKPKIDVLATSGHETCDERGSIAPAHQSDIVEPKNTDKSILYELPRLIVNVMDKTLKENMETPKEEEPKALELVEKLEFTDGLNKIEIRFSKRHNRMFRIQIFLNGETEIRPVTYTGASTGHSYWNLLKKCLNK